MEIPGKLVVGPRRGLPYTRCLRWRAQVSPRRHLKAKIKKLNIDMRGDKAMYQ